MVLGLSCLGYFFVLLDVTIVNVALDSISTGLSASRSQLQWVVDGYALALGSLMLSAGHMADGFGRRRVFVFGLVTFGAATAACALAPTPGALIAARVLQGIGAAALLPASLALVNASRRDPAERARAIGIWAGLGSLGLVVGPLLGGVLTGAFGWRAVFWFSVPLCALAALASARWVDESRGPREGRRLDPLGQLTGVVFLACLVGALIEGPNLGWTAPPIVVSILLAAASLAALIAVERRAAHPMLELGFFRNPGFSASNAGAGLMNLGVLGGLFVLSLLLQQGQGRSPEATGLLIVPLALPLAVLPPFVGRVIERIGARWPAALGLAGTGIGFGFARRRRLGRPVRRHAGADAPGGRLAGLRDTGCGHGRDGIRGGRPRGHGFGRQQHGAAVWRGGRSGAHRRHRRSERVRGQRVGAPRRRPVERGADSLGVVLMQPTPAVCPSGGREVAP